MYVLPILSCMASSNNWGAFVASTTINLVLGVPVLYKNALIAFRKFSLISSSPALLLKNASASSTNINIPN